MVKAIKLTKKVTMKRILLPVLLSLSFGAFARTMNVTHLPEGSASYFKVNVQDDGLLKGSYPGWCADWNTAIEDGVQYNTTFWSSLAADIPGDVVDHPENLDEVNWIINQKFAGKSAPNGLGKYTMGDEQLAIWTMIDDSFDASSVGPYSQARVDHIVSRARVEGSGYEPGCRKLVGIILIPTDPHDGHKTQNTIILVPRYKFPKCVVPDTDTDLN